MNASLNYFIEANISLLLMLGAYALLLKNETDFRLQRMFLLGSIFTSLLFPLIHIQFNTPAFPTLTQIIPTYWLPEIIITEDSLKQTAASPRTTNVWYYLSWIYFAGVGFFFIRFLIRLVQLLSFVRNGRAIRNGKLTVIETSASLPTFSFFNIIVLGECDSLSSNEKHHILEHESTHARQLHSLDIILISMLSIVFWFNPLLSIYKKYFVQIHEFEADARAVEDRDVSKYCSLLARRALESAGFKLANHFNNSLTLKRIQMMKTIKQKVKPWKRVAIACLIPLTFAIVSCQDQLANEISEIAKQSTMATNVPEEIQKHFDELLTDNPDKKYLLIETKDGTRKVIEGAKEQYDRLQEVHISRIDVLKPTVESSEKERTFVIFEYTDDLATIIEKSKDENGVYRIVEETAMPEGGMEKFYEYVATNLSYPKQARELGVEGKVFIEFIVQEDGSITDAKVVKGIGAGCDKAALEIVKSSPQWIPGKNKGAAVKQSMVLPISFALN